MSNSDDDSIFNNSDCILALATQIEDPDDYYVGHHIGQPGMPESVLFFLRRERQRGGPPSSHHRAMLITNLMTDGSVIIDDRVFRLTPGHATLVLPHQFHHYADFSAEKAYWLFLTFEHPEAESLAEIGGTVLNYDRFQSDCLSEAVRAYLEGSPVLLGGLLTSLLERWRAQLRAGSGLPRPTPGNRLIEQVARFVHAHLAEPILIDDVAAHVHRSESHLRAAFKKATGIGLGAYIRRVRIHRAKVLMESDRNIGEIAAQCGFASVYAFSRTFRQSTGMSPTAYRKQHARTDGSA